MVSFKDWPWEVLKIKFPVALALPTGFPKAKWIRDSSRTIPNDSKEWNWWPWSTMIKSLDESKASLTISHSFVPWTFTILLATGETLYQGLWLFCVQQGSCSSMKAGTHGGLDTSLPRRTIHQGHQGSTPTETVSVLITPTTLASVGTGGQMREKVGKQCLVGDYYAPNILWSRALWRCWEKSGPYEQQSSLVVFGFRQT